METPPKPTPEKPENSLEQKLEEVLVVLKKIEKNTHESFWPAVIKFTIANLWTIVGFGIILFFVWRIWGVLSGISEGVNFLKDNSLRLLEKLSNSAGSLKFWE